MGIEMHDPLVYNSAGLMPTNYMSAINLSKITMRAMDSTQVIYSVRASCS